MANQLVTVLVIAQKAEVSRVTVSRVLNNSGSVNKETRQRVLKVATELGYFSNRRGVATVSPESDTAFKQIGFFLVRGGSRKNEMGSFWSRILDGAEDEGRQSNARIMYSGIEDGDSLQEQGLPSIYEMRLSGLLLVGQSNLGMFETIAGMNIPLVLVDNHIPDFPVDSVVSDNFQGGALATNYLIHHGHRRIAFIGGPVAAGARPTDTIYAIAWRTRGYWDALQNADIAIDPALFVSGDLTPAGGYAACKSLLDTNVPFSALFCANDPTALGAMKALRQAGRRVPEDVSVVGFDDDVMAMHLDPSLTTIAVKKEAMGAVAVKMLLARLRSPDAIHAQITLPVELIERESVAAYQT